MAGYKIPTVLNNFNVYGNGTKFIGVSSETTLPNLESITETIEGAGISGEIEEAVQGAFSSIETEDTFTNLSKEYFRLASLNGLVTYRGSMQVLNTSTQVNDFVPVVVTTGGRAKNLDLGAFKKGGKGEPKVTHEITYIKITISNEVLLELDKFNMIFKLNGVDLLQKVRSQI